MPDGSSAMPANHSKPAFARPPAWPQLAASVLPPELQAAAVELAGYIANSFGDAPRIDYGTGVCVSLWLSGSVTQRVDGFAWCMTGVGCSSITCGSNARGIRTD